MQTFTLNERANFLPNQTATANTRNLGKSQLGGVIFGCKNSTIRECLFKQLFGLPGQHFSYVKNIDPGLPLFLFNYSERKVHGIFEAASSGQMNINPYAWTTDGSERTLYPAQVQIRVRLQCQALSESQFKPILMDNYYTQYHFWFELDHAQTSKLLSLLSSLAIAPSTPIPQNTAKWRAMNRALPSSDRREGNEDFEYPPLEVDASRSRKPNGELGFSDAALFLDDSHQTLEDCSPKIVAENDERDLIYMKLKELALSRDRSDSTCTGGEEETAVVNDVSLKNKAVLEEQMIREEKNEPFPANSSEHPDVIAKLIQGMEELKMFKTEQLQKTGYLEKKLVEAEIEIQQLRKRCMILEFMSKPPVACDDMTGNVSSNAINLDPDDLVYLAGGYDGVSWLSSLDCYSPSQDVIKSLKPMNSIRSYASVAKLNGELYVFGGGNSSLWYETVESYNPVNNEWTPRPPLNDKKGSLAGATLNGKIFALGGGNGSECFSDVEMLDLDVGRWILTRSMLQKRFALAAVELNGAVYAVGGYDGKDYLKSAERFDPREHSWTRIEGMSTQRGCHSLIVMNENIYALGGYDGNTMVESTEIYDPRLGTWIIGEPMKSPRGYSAAAVLHESIYVIGGLKTGDRIVDTVEFYKEGKGWELTNLKGTGQRCFASAIVL